jgi:hypothetical protein
MIERDIPNHERYLQRYAPADPTGWYDAYKKMRKLANKAELNAEAALKAALKGAQSEKEQQVVEVVGSAKRAALWISSDAPGPNKRARMSYNYNSGKTGSKGAHKMTVMEKIRKEARSFKTGVMDRPMHELKKKFNGVSKPPPSFVEELKRKKEQQAEQAQRALSRPAQTTKPLAPWEQPPKPKVQPAKASGVEPYDMTSDREARLRALKAGKPLPSRVSSPPPATGKQKQNLTVDFLESDSDVEAPPVNVQPKKRRREEDDDIFGSSGASDTSNDYQKLNSSNGRPVKKRAIINSGHDRSAKMRAASNSGSDSASSAPSARRRQIEEDDELFGDFQPSKKRKAILQDDSDVSPPPTMSKPSINGHSSALKPSRPPNTTTTSSPKISKLPAKTHLSPHPATTSNHYKLPAQNLHSDSATSPANSARNSPMLKPTMRKREAHSLFMKRK